MNEKWDTEHGSERFEQISPMRVNVSHAQLFSEEQAIATLWSRI